MAEERDRTVYRLVVNHEEQYSIWPAALEAPKGWKEVGEPGVLDDTVAHLKKLLA